MRNLSYSPGVRRVVRAFGLKKVAQNLYRRLVQQGDSILISAGGVSGRFFPASPRDLRIVEASAQEAALARLLGEVRPEDIVYDVGAHHGLYAILLAQKVKCIIAFEPERECHARLRHNVGLNSLENVTSYCKALGSQNTQTTLYLGDGVGAINRGQLGSEWTAGERQAIEIVRGDDFCRSEKLPPPTVLKIDVEGYEGAVLEGLRQSLGLPECRLVCCEIHPALLPQPETTESVIEILKGCGFSDIQLFPHKTEFHAFARK